MKLKKDLVLRHVADTWVVIPLTTANVSFNGMITLNESGVKLWKALEAGADKTALAEMLTKEYTVDFEQAMEDVEAFLRKLLEKELLETV